MSFWCLQFPPKNERKQVDLWFHSSKVEFVRLFFGRNGGLKKSFRLRFCLTFSADWPFSMHLGWWEFSYLRMASKLARPICNWKCKESWNLNFLEKTSNTIVPSDASYSWSRQDSSTKATQSQATLTNINMEVKPGQLVAIVGQV